MATPSPVRHLPGAGPHGLVVAPDQRGQHVRPGRREVVAGSVEVRRHGRDPRQPVLAADRLDLQDAGDLRDRVGVVGRFEGPRQQRLLDDGLRREPRVDARRAQEQQPLDLGRPRGVEDVHLDADVLAEEVDRVRRVRHDPADLRRREDDVARAVRTEEVVHGVAVGEVELRGGLPHEPGEPRPFQPAPDRRADQAAVAGDVEDGVPVERRRFVADEVALVGRRHAASHVASATRSIHGDPAWLRASTSASTMMRASSRPSTVGFHPRSTCARLGSPTRASTSVGRR